MGCDQLEACLQHIFTKYCEPAPPRPVPGGQSLLTPPEGAYITQSGLDSWARDTNGAPFSQETKDELIEFLDVTDNGELTYVFASPYAFHFNRFRFRFSFKGFLQIYQLQTENDEEETWRDLASRVAHRRLHDI